MSLEIDLSILVPQYEYITLVQIATLWSYLLLDKYYEHSNIELILYKVVRYITK